MRNRKTKSILALAAAVLLLTVVVGSTLAYLTDVSGEVKNTFEPSRVTCSVVETGWSEGNNAKPSIQIQNTGTVDAYIRVTVTANWCDENGNIVEPCDDVITFINDHLNSNWVQVGNFYYYTQIVPAGELTDNLITSPIVQGVVPASADHLEVKVICQAVQADGMGATGAQNAFDKAALGI